MTVATAQFHPCCPRPWTGRYARIMGNGSVFHLQNAAGRLWPVILWQTTDGIATCRAVTCDAANDLADAVAGVKRHADGQGGGSFLINEHGQVLVPSSNGDGRRFLAGRLDGTLLFENPFD